MSDKELDPLLKVIEARPTIAERFESQRRVARQTGYFSLVFQARDIETGNAVALKFLRPEVAARDDYRRACFAREALILDALRGQPHVIQLQQGRTQITIPLTDQATGLQVHFPLEFIALEWADSTLETTIAEGGVDPRTVICQFRDICKGVQRLLSRRICHRDLKPGNCLILPDGTVVIGDFGTAHDYSDGTSPLRPWYDQPVGDIRYMALELRCGLGLDEQWATSAEFFSLGAILFELFTLVPLATCISADVHDFAAHMLVTPRPDRRNVFDGVVSDLVNAWKLPDIREFTDRLPNTIAPRVNRLYTSLAHLDYRRRTTDFVSIFQDLATCAHLLEHQDAYRRWIAFKRRRRSARMSRRQRQIDSRGSHELD